jgi:hypothetical protein
MSDSTKGKQIFSNPPHPESAFTPVMKKLSEVPAFDKHVHAAKSAANAASSPEVAVYENGGDATASPGSPIIISGSGPVKVTYNTVTIEPGGQILVYTAADITINKLIKK